VFEVGCRREEGVSGPGEVVDCHCREPQLCFEMGGNKDLDSCKERSRSIEVAYLGHLQVGCKFERCLKLHTLSRTVN